MKTNPWRNAPTERQVQVMRAIADAVASGKPPTVRELAKLLGIKESSAPAAFSHLTALRKKGLVSKHRAELTAMGVIVLANRSPQRTQSF